MSARIQTAGDSQSATNADREPDPTTKADTTAISPANSAAPNVKLLALTGAAHPPLSNPANAITEIQAAADLGRLVRKAREEKDLTQQEFADLTGVGRRFISELENGKPTIEFGKALKVALAAGIAIHGRQR